MITSAFPNDAPNVHCTKESQIVQDDEACPPVVVIQLAPFAISVSAGEDPLEGVWRRRDEWKDRLFITVQQPCSNLKHQQRSLPKAVPPQIRVSGIAGFSHIVDSRPTPPVTQQHHGNCEFEKSMRTTKKTVAALSTRSLADHKSKEQSAQLESSNSNSRDDGCYHYEGDVVEGDDDGNSTQCSDVYEFDGLAIDDYQVDDLHSALVSSKECLLEVEDDDASSTASLHTLRTTVHNILGLSSMLLSMSDNDSSNTSRMTDYDEEEEDKDVAAPLSAINKKCVARTLQEIHDSGRELQDHLFRKTPTPTASQKRSRRRHLGSCSAPVPKNICTSTTNIRTTKRRATTTTLSPPPVRSDDDEKAAAATDYNAKFRNSSVLLADDNAINRKLLVNMLRRLGFQHVHAVANGQQVLDVLDRNADGTSAAQAYDFILLDIDMPVLSGRACWRELQRRQITTPVAFVTGHVQERTTEAAADGFLSKPFCVDDVRGLMAGLVDLRKGSS